MIVARVISGAQSGADQGALFGAEAAGVPTGGTCPKGCRTEFGDRLDLITRFGLIESTSRAYDVRTYENIRNSDGTVIFGDVNAEGGTKLTYQIAQVYKKNYLLLSGGEAFRASGAAALRQWLQRHGINVVNVAGPRESKCPGIYQRVFDVLAEALR